MSAMDERLVGKVAVVTGGASGIGAATARRLISEGASVVIGDLNGDAAAELAAELGDRALAVRFDAADVDSVRTLIANAIERFARIDILHNNAALLGPKYFAKDTNAVDIDFDMWDLTFAVNIRGYLAGCKFAIPHMIANGGGSIINTGSTAGLRGDIANFAYGCTKAAIMSMTRSIATVYGPQGIRCNTVIPGPIRTAASEANAKSSSTRTEMILRQVVLGRYGRPDDLAAAVAWLASDDAGFVTGTEILVDGGMLCHAPYTADFLSVQ